MEDELKQSVRLDMKREGRNKYDHFAIALWYRQTKIGFIPKDKNQVLARLMDAGKQFYASITSKEIEGNWLKVEIQVMMKD